MDECAMDMTQNLHLRFPLLRRTRRFSTIAFGAFVERRSHLMPFVKSQAWTSETIFFHPRIHLVRDPRRSTLGILNLPVRRILRRGGHSHARVSNPSKGKRACPELNESSHPQHQVIHNEEKVNSNVPIRHTSKGERDRDQKIDQLREDIRSFSETMKNYMAKQVTPQGSRCHNLPRQA